MQNRIFSMDSPKAVKAAKFGYLNAIHYMAPGSDAGVGNLCPKASAGCLASCLGKYYGQASMVADLENGTNSTRESRREKARRFMRDRVAYLRDMVSSIDRARYKAGSIGKKLCVRLNGSTDIAWEMIRVDGNKTLFDLFPDVQFVDYTKIAARFSRKLPANYWLTFSRSESNEAEARALLARGVNVTVVFADMDAARDFWNDIGARVVDGDEHDLRHLDPRAAAGQPGYIIALSPKGAKAKRDTSGFVVR